MCPTEETHRVTLKPLNSTVVMHGSNQNYKSSHQPTTYYAVARCKHHLNIQTPCPTRPNFNSVTSCAVNVCNTIPDSQNSRQPMGTNTYVSLPVAGNPLPSTCQACSSPATPLRDHLLLARQPSALALDVCDNFLRF